MSLASGDSMDASMMASVDSSVMASVDEAGPRPPVTASQYAPHAASTRPGRHDCGCGEFRPSRLGCVMPGHVGVLLSPAMLQ